MHWCYPSSGTTNISHIRHYFTQIKRICGILRSHYHLPLCSVSSIFLSLLKFKVLFHFANFDYALLINNSYSHIFIISFSFLQKRASLFLIVICKSLNHFVIYYGYCLLQFCPICPNDFDRQIDSLSK